LEYVGADSADDFSQFVIRRVDDESDGFAEPIFWHHGAKSLGAGKIKVARAFGKENEANIIDASGECRFERCLVGHAADFHSSGHG
jgi:hypothetical protein